MKHPHSSRRRDFLKLSAGLAALGTLGATMAGRKAQATQIGDYKALVCVYLFGGNDGNNVIVPLDATRYAAYQNIRGNLALTGNKLLSPIADAQGNPYALHYGLPELNALYNAGHLAVVLNVGTLDRPLTRAQYLQGANVPSSLFSHSDQIVQTQLGQPFGSPYGWGGSLLSRLGAGQDSLAGISVAKPALFLQGNGVTGNVVSPGTDLSLYGMNLWPDAAATARRQALTQILALNGGNFVRQAANQTFSDGLVLADALKSNANLAPLSATFPGDSIGNQLKEVARLIRMRAQQGPGRQVFFCALDGFDTHGSQDWQHWDLLSRLSKALSAFYDAMGEAGLAEQVTAFTQSEFGRTFQSNGSGSDHGWGNHQLVLGGAVHGGIFGSWPEFALGGPTDANDRGVWIPGISIAQFGATLGRWFGADDADLAAAFPSLANFASGNVGFMQG